MGAAAGLFLLLVWMGWQRQVGSAEKLAFAVAEIVCVSALVLLLPPPGGLALCKRREPRADDARREHNCTRVGGQRGEALGPQGLVYRGLRENQGAVRRSGQVRSRQGGRRRHHHHLLWRRVWCPGGGVRGQQRRLDVGVRAGGPACDALAHLGGQQRDDVHHLPRAHTAAGGSQLVWSDVPGCRWGTQGTEVRQSAALHAPGGRAGGPGA